LSWISSNEVLFFDLPDGIQSEYAAGLKHSLERWLDGDPQIVELIGKLSQIHREDILNSTKTCMQEASHAARKL